MNKIVLAVAASALMVGCSNNTADADNDGNISADEVAKVMNEVTLEPGEWENTVEIVDIKIAGLPEGAPTNMMDSMKTTTVSKSCITEEQARNPGAEFFAAQEKTNCIVKKFDMSGGAAVLGAMQAIGELQRQAVLAGGEETNAAAPAAPERRRGTCARWRCDRRGAAALPR